MKKKHIVLIVLIIVSSILAIGIGLFIKKLFEPEEEIINRVYAETGETIRVEELVSVEHYRSATISPELIFPSFSSDAEVRDNGQSVFVGYTMGAFDVIVYVTDEEGKVTEERVRIVLKIKD